MKQRIAFLCMLCGVLVLSGCGGASGSRTNELEDRVTTAEALVAELRANLQAAQTEAANAKTAAEAADAAAEAARIRAELAEAEATAANAAQVAAEARATAAETAQAAAEARATAAAAAQTAAEARATAAAAAQAGAETRAAEAEAARNEALKQAAEAEAARDEALKQAADTETGRGEALTRAREAEAARDAALTRAREAETARDLAQQQARDAEAARDLAQQQARDAETERDLAQQQARDAVAARDLAQQQARDAVAARDAALAAQRTAEQQRQQAEEDKAEAERLVSQADAQVAFRGFFDSGQMLATPAALPGTGSGSELGSRLDNVKAYHGTRAATFTTPTDVPQTPSTTSTSSMGRWLKTTITNSGGQYADVIEIYSDVETPARVAFNASHLNTHQPADLGAGLGVLQGTARTENVVDAEGKLSWARVRLVTISTGTGADAKSRDDTTSGAFPRQTGPATPYTLADRGRYVRVPVPTGDRTRLRLGTTTNEPFSPNTPLFTVYAINDTTTTTALPFDVDPTTAVSNETQLTASEVTSLINLARRECQTAGSCGSENYALRDQARYPLRWNYEAGGTLQGASGTFTCASGTVPGTTPQCTVQNRGTVFHFVGPWAFRPSSATTPVSIPDANYMWFGWWGRETVTGGGTFAFTASHGCSLTGATPGCTPVSPAEISGVSGTATYRGTAVGQYAIYQPLGEQSGYGPFTATAVLVADFTNDRVSGTIDDFSDHPDWVVTLKPGTIATTGDEATVSIEDTAGENNGPVSWAIGARAYESDDSDWEATFYSNLPDGGRTGVLPYGIAGIFYAEHGLVESNTVVGKMIGAFGAHSR